MNVFREVRGIRRLALFLLLAFAYGVASAQEFIGYEGKNAVREGDGGAKKTVEGVDFGPTERLLESSS